VDNKDIVELVKALSWPVTAILAVYLFYGPLRELIRAIGTRGTKFSAFKVEFELAKLTPALASLETTVEGLRQAAIAESGAAPIAAGVSQSGAADYVLIALGADADQEWLTSRLYLVAAILERSRAVRCIVFTGEKGVFLGAATPRDIRAELGAKFPEYEKSLLAAYAAASWVDIGEFRGGNLGPAVVNRVTNAFLSPGGPIVQFGNSPSPGTGWVFLTRTSAPSTWEFAEWVTAGGLASMLRGRMAGGSVCASPAIVSEEVTRAIVRESGTFVGLVNREGVFQTLCDRSVIVDKIARSAADQSVVV
jgi:hypothetical protein